LAMAWQAGKRQKKSNLACLPRRSFSESGQILCKIIFFPAKYRKPNGRCQENPGHDK
jgi:hypothetical protein